MSVIRDVKIKNSSGTYDTYDIGADATNVKYDNSKNVKQKIDSLIPIDIGAIGISQIGMSGGVASLDNTGKVPSTQLPTMGTAAAKDFTTSVTSGSADLVTSGAVYTALGTIASHAFTAINYSVWFYPYVANTEYIPLTDWNPPAAGYMFLFVEQGWNNSMPTYIRVEKFIDSGSNGTKWQPIAVLSIEQANLGIHHLKLPVITPVAITDKFRFICKGAQNTSGNNQLILNGFVMS